MKIIIGSYNFVRKDLKQTNLNNHVDIIQKITTCIAKIL